VWGSSAGSSLSGKPTSVFATPPGFPGWNPNQYFTIDLSTSTDDVHTAGLVAQNVQNFLIANVFSQQLNPDPTNAQTNPSDSQRAVLELKDAPTLANPTPPPWADPQNGTVANWYNLDSPAGYGPNQVNGGHNLWITNIFSDGGTPLRFETDASGDAKPPYPGELHGVTATYIAGENCNRVVSFTPHNQVNSDVNVANVFAQDCYEGVVESVESIDHGAFLSSSITNVAVTGGGSSTGTCPGAQVVVPGGGGWTCGISTKAFAYQPPNATPGSTVLTCPRAAPSASARPASPVPTATPPWRVQYPRARVLQRHVHGGEERPDPPVHTVPFHAHGRGSVNAPAAPNRSPVRRRISVLAGTALLVGATGLTVPATAAPNPPCGKHLSASYTLTRDIGPCHTAAWWSMSTTSPSTSTAFGSSARPGATTASASA